MEEYYITPYNREIYALTALKKGKYSLGCKFHIEGNPLFLFSPMIKESLKKMSKLWIYHPKASQFFWRGWEYKVKIIMDKKRTAVGIPIFCRSYFWRKGQEFYLKTLTKFLQG